MGWRRFALARPYEAQGSGVCQVISSTFAVAAIAASSSQKRTQQFIRVHNETLSVAAMCVRNAIDYAKFRSRSHDAVIRVYDECAENL